MTRMRREIALEVWDKALGKPYLWGGNDPILGFDCSGLVIEGLKSAGILPREDDWSAEALAHQVFKDWPRLPEALLLPGCLVFYGTPAGLTHVEVIYERAEGLLITIGASGGGSATTSVEAAAKQDAYVKLRPMRAGWLEALDPFASPNQVRTT